ncbi:hypothetical protein L2719_18000 [Shewanella schlegeliana]|uniref:Uncharacterized protein n=1 Tax=Shewanella schlegeliana TaxID=190308 RepID=A0ABS1T0J0_9GAMM|nr:hypothetical protein [Shewanella schlegeliana]MBL4914184.1 hypothetical protein [Shewanella schlegeliana]MCL1111422.1 hypothetical protein [Shewanella schlegeliana]
MEVSEQYSQEARMQLDFYSFMAVAIWGGFGVAITSAVAMQLVVTTAATSTEVESSMFLFSSAVYGFLGFLFSLLGSAGIYPLYKFWCDKKRGLRVTGRFAFINRGDNKPLNSDSPRLSCHLLCKSPASTWFTY